MAFQLAEAFVEFKSQGHRSVERAVDGIRQSLLKVNRLATSEVGKLLGLARGGLSAAVSVASGVARGVGKALDEYAKHEQSVRMLNAQLKMTGGVVGFSSSALQQLASDLQKVSSFSNETTLAAQSLLLSFTNIRGDVFRGTLEAAMDLSTVINQDLNSSIAQLGKALNDPVNGIMALSRVGVVFTAAQKDTIKTLVESGRVMEAQKVILGELRNEFGGAARADMQTFTGQLQTMLNSFSDMLESIGAIYAESVPARVFTASMSEAFRATGDLIKLLAGSDGSNTEFLADVAKSARLAVLTIEAVVLKVVELFSTLKDNKGILTSALRATGFQSAAAVMDLISPDSEEEKRRIAEARKKNEQAIFDLVTDAAPPEITSNADFSGLSIGGPTGRGGIERAKKRKQLEKLDALANSFLTPPRGIDKAKSAREKRKKFEELEALVQSVLAPPVGITIGAAQNNADLGARMRQIQQEFEAENQPEKLQMRSGRFNIGDLANRIQDSINSNAEKFAKDTADNTKAMRETLDQINENTQVVPVPRFVG